MSSACWLARGVAALVVVLALAAAAPAEAPGPVLRAGSAQFAPDGYRLAVPPYAFVFPLDHAAHPAYRSEWWYYTGHLRAGGREFGYELTFFRVGLPVAAGGKRDSAWRARHVIFRHLALTDESARRFRTQERADRQALDLAGADSTRYLVWLGDDYAGLEADRTTHRLVGHGDDFALDLRLVPEKPPVVHGELGVSQKAAGMGNASHYYSFTRLATRGRLVIDRDTLEVTGRSWMDHEFGSNQMQETHAGWDWFSVQLSDGRDLMLYRLRQKGGGLEPFSSGTLVEADGRSQHIAYADFDTGPTGEWRSPRTGGRYPSGWRLRLPNEGIELTLSPTLPDQELVVNSMGGLAYWEGSVRVTGKSAGKPVTGQGYVELTGYAGRSPF